LKPTLLLAFLARFKGSIIQDEIFRLAAVGMTAVSDELGAKEEKRLPDDICQYLQANGADWDDFMYRTSRDLLLRYSLIQYAGGEWHGVTTHSLVQRRAMQYRKAERWQWWYVLGVVAACTQVTKESHRPQFRRHLVVHVPEISTASLARFDIPEEMMDFVWRNITKVYYDEGRWEEAEKLYLKVGRCGKAVRASNGDSQDEARRRPSRHADQHGQLGIYMERNRQRNGGCKTYGRMCTNTYSCLGT
jgi:hypothetical protein